MELKRSIHTLSFMVFKSLLSDKMCVNLMPTETIIPIYHLVSDDYLPHVSQIISYPTIKKFTKDIDYYLKYFDTADPQNYINGDCFSNKSSKRKFILTFDDGYAECYHIIRPILLKKGIPAMFFINQSPINNLELLYTNKISLLLSKINKKSVTKNIDKILEILNDERIYDKGIYYSIRRNIKYSNRYILDALSPLFEIDYNDYVRLNRPYLTEDHLIQMSNEGFLLGAHSIDHPLISELPYQNQINQIMDSVNYTINTFKLNYKFFAFPFHDLNNNLSLYNYFSDKGMVFFGTQSFKKDPIQHSVQRFGVNGEDTIEEQMKLLVFKKFTNQLLNMNNINR